MSGKCYLECYVPVSSLIGEAKEYWDSYIEKVIPKTKENKPKDSAELKAIVKNTLSSFDENKYGLTPHSFIDGEYYVYGGDMKFKYCIPDQFMACFDSKDVFETNINKDKYDALSEEDKIHEDYVYKYFRLKTTASKAKRLLKEHLKGQSPDYINFGNQVLEFLESKDDKSIIELFSGEICLESSVEDLFSYVPLN